MSDLSSRVEEAKEKAKGLFHHAKAKAEEAKAEHLDKKADSDSSETGIAEKPADNIVGNAGTSKPSEHLANVHYSATDSNGLDADSLAARREEDERLRKELDSL